MSDEQSQVAAEGAQQVDQVELQEQQDQPPEDPSAAGIMVTLLVPSQSFLQLPAAAAANTTSDGFLELPLPLALTDAVHDLRNIITDAPEGFWLGAFSLAPYYAEEKSDVEVKEGEEKQYGEWQKLQPPPRKAASGPEPDLSQWALTKEGVLGDYADLTACFGDVEFWEKKKRALRVVFTAYTNTSLHLHLLKVRDVLFSSLPPLASSPSSYDPSAFAIASGTSLYASVAGEEQAASMETSEEEGKGKKGKNVKKAESTPAPAAESSLPSTDAKHAFSDWSVEDLKPENFLKHISVASSLSAVSPCIKQLGVSPWSPPPHPRRLRGDLIYLTISTLESESFTITGSTSGFWVSKSSATTFDPSPRALLPKGVRSGAYQSLFELLSDISPFFKRNLAAIIAKSTRTDLTQSELVASLAISHTLPSAPFLVRAPQHVADPFRTQAAYLLTSSTTAEALPAARDWNDEYGQFADLPRSSVPERLLRERLLCRQQADFVAAATRGALSIARGDVAPLNPNEPPAAYTYLHSNLLYTKAEDATGLFSEQGKSEASRYTAGKDLKGIELLEKLDVEGLSVMQTVLVDYRGERWVVQSVIPGLFKPPREGEEAAIGADDIATTTYPVGDGSAAAAAEEARKGDKPFPSEETPNKEDYPPATAFRIVYGASNPELPDEKVRASAYFHEKLAKKVAKGMRFAEHEVKDSEGRKTKLFTASDMHGIAAPDGRSYFIDCFRLQCVDVEFREKDIEGTVAYPHRLVLLRPELLEAYRESKLQKWLEEQVAIKRAEVEKEQKSIEAELKDATSESTEEKKEGEEEVPQQTTSVINADDFILDFNPDAFIERKEKLVIYDEDAEATKNVRLASQYLRDVVLAEFLAEAAANSFTVTDGFFLTKVLHRKGINMRYLGLLAKKIDEEGDKVDFGKAQNKNEAEYTLQLLKNTLQSEMVIRAAKHLLNRLLRSASPYDHSFIVAHFLNCLLGASFNASPIAETASIPAGAEADRSWTETTPASLRSDLIKEVAARFRYDLPNTFVDEQLPKVKVARELSLRVGIQLLARKYDFGTGVSDLSASVAAVVEPTAAASPNEEPSASTASKNKKKKKSGKAAAAAEEKKADVPPATFNADDVLNLGPVVKATAHKSTLVDETFAHGQRAISEGQIEIGEAVVNEALHLCEQIFGAVHPEQAQKYHSLGLVWHNLASRIANQIRNHDMAEQALKELAPEDREQHEARIRDLLLPDVALARQEQESFIQQAVRMVRQSIVISERVNGVDSHDAIQQYADLGLLEHGAGNVEVGLRLSKHAMDLWTAAYGPRHPALVTLLSNIAQMVQGAYGPEAALPIALEYRKLAELVHGADSVPVGQAEHAVGQAYALCSDITNALEHIKAAHAVLSVHLGDDAKDVQEAHQFIRLVESSVAQQAAEQKIREEQIARARQEGLTNKTRPRVGANGAALPATDGRSAFAQDKQPEAPVQRQHGQKGDLPLDDLVNYITGTTAKSSTSSKASRKRKPSP